MPDASVELKLPENVPKEICPLEDFVRMNDDWLHQPRHDADMERPTRGLANLGNTCFMNATLQCLAGSPTLRAFMNSDLSHTQTCKRLLGEGHTDAFVVFEKCIKCMISQPQAGKEKNALKPIPFKVSHVNTQNQLNQVIKTYRSGAQEDAHEYAVNLLDYMHKMAVDLMRETYHLSKALVQKQQNWQLSSSIYHIFGGKIRSQVVCAACGYQSNTYDPTVDLSLEIGGSNKCRSVEDCLALFTHVETLGSSNEYSCDKCKQKSRATKQLTIHTLPNVLMLHLKRFDVMSTVYGGKISKDIRYRDTLDLGPYVSSPKGGAEDAHYSLFGVLVHKGGGVRSGHYYSYVKTRGVWRLYDDSTVDEVTEQDALSDEAYILFYTRRSTRTEALHRNDDMGTPFAPCLQHKQNVDSGRSQVPNYGIHFNGDRAFQTPPEILAPLPLPSSSTRAASSFCPMMPPGGIESFRASLNQPSTTALNSMDESASLLPPGRTAMGDLLGQFEGVRDLESLDDEDAVDEEVGKANGNGHLAVKEDAWSQETTQQTEAVRDDGSREAHPTAEGGGNTAGVEGGSRLVREAGGWRDVERDEVAGPVQTGIKRKRNEGLQELLELVADLVGEGAWNVEELCSSIVRENRIDVRDFVVRRLCSGGGGISCRGVSKGEFLQLMKGECRGKFGRAISEQAGPTLLKALDELSAVYMGRRRAHPS